MSEKAQMQARLGQNLTAFGFLFVFLMINMLSVRHKSLTADEAKHFLYGQNILNLNSDRLGGVTDVVDDSKMPFSAINALPAKIAGLLSDGWLKTLLGKFFTARLMTVLFSCLVAWLVFEWSRSLYGFVPGIVSLILYTFDPNVIAHSQLVTTDIYAAGMIAFSFYWLWKYANSRRMRDGVFCLMMLGLAQLAKFTSVVLLPLMFIALILHDLPTQIETYAANGFSSIKKYLSGLSISFFAAIFSFLLIVNFGYFLNRSFQSFGTYEFRSSTLNSLQARFTALSGVPVPLPYPYLQGLDLISYRQSTGFGYGRVYLLGQLRESGGFPGYFIIASLLKVPVASQLILVGAFIVYFSNKKDRNRFWRDEVFLLLPSLFFVIYFNFFFQTQIGIRFYLVIFPLLYVFAGQLFQNWHRFSAWQKIGGYMLMGYLVLSVLSYHPHYLAYFNEIVYDRRFSYKFLADSNLDWEQGQYYLQDYLVDYPDARFEPKKVDYGHLVISVNSLVGVVGDPTQYQYLREYFEPTNTIAYSYLIYKITPDDFFAMCRKTNYCDNLQETP